MKIIELLIVLFLIFILAKFYTGGSQNEKGGEVIKHQKIYMESQEKLKKATEAMEEEYEKYKD
ncbi:hypothetical protein [Psychrilyobacter atlanticus]|uniref:hypothetical protein n=1 Tax=Psychrilyobacter atlanticus TaxID=271091 RepID=UPI0003F62677|nr:hypothetical protein [Psychrilyobacter atlanticus]